MSSLSIVIPALPSDSSTLEDTLASVLRERPATCQILVPHSGWYSDHHDLKSLGVELVDIADGRSHGELSLAVLSRCRHEIVHWIRPGMSVEDGWTEQVEAIFEQPNVASASPVITEPNCRSQHGIILGLTHTKYRPRTVTQRKRGRIETPIGPTEWGAFYRRQALAAVLPHLIDLSQVRLDLEISFWFREMGWRNEVAQHSTLTWEARSSIGDELSRSPGWGAVRLAALFDPSPVVALVAGNLLQVGVEIVQSIVNPPLARHAVQRMIGTGIFFHRSPLRKNVLATQARTLPSLTHASREETPLASSTAAKRAA